MWAAVRAWMFKEANQRGLFTTSGFVAFVAGVGIQFGPGVALLIGGGLVFAAGMYGMLRK